MPPIKTHLIIKQLHKQIVKEVKYSIDKRKFVDFMQSMQVVMREQDEISKTFENLQDSWWK